MLLANILTAKVASLVAAGVVATGGAAAAATGNLPGPMQNAVANVAGDIGVSLPKPAETPAGTPDPARTPGGAPHTSKAPNPSESARAEHHNDGQATTNPSAEPSEDHPHAAASASANHGDDGKGDDNGRRDHGQGVGTGKGQGDEHRAEPSKPAKEREKHDSKPGDQGGAKGSDDRKVKPIPAAGTPTPRASDDSHHDNGDTGKDGQSHNG